MVCGYHFNQMAAEALADRLTAARAGKTNRAVALGVDVTDEQSVAAFLTRRLRLSGALTFWLMRAGSADLTC